ncbi:MAG: HAMP domain-containing protein [Acidobacteria bacterium]|nr:HAMP domain-containing protein [Acidobacteriota bacterium]
MRSLRRKLLTWVLPLFLIPLAGISIFSYFVAEKRITEDRTVLYLEQIARDVADNLRLTLLEKQEETVSMSLHREFREYLQGGSPLASQMLLDQLLVIHQVYDLLVLFNRNGDIVLTNSIHRKQIELPLESEKLTELRGKSLLEFTPDPRWLPEVQAGRFAYLAWHASPLVERLYGYSNEDIALRYHVGFITPILDREGAMAGGILALMSWEFIQEILDKIEQDLEEKSFSSGYSFLIANDGNTIIGHKFRRNRRYHTVDPSGWEVDNYGTRLEQDHQLHDLKKALQEGKTFFRYEYPPGVRKISGLAAVDHDVFSWTCGVGINDEHIFAPVIQLRNYLMLATIFSALAVILLTYWSAHGITIPLNRLKEGAYEIASGNLSQRVEVTTNDEIGQLARTFNEMAQSLEERTRAVNELNRSLEEKVKERTQELEKTNQAMQRAYEELKSTQGQLIQSEKMASLGQLVAGIAHEIKNPLNFIYGNTEFLKNYVSKLGQLIKLYEERAILDAEARGVLQEFKEKINYQFLCEDLDVLVRNFEEGAKRINAIIADLRSFSRTETDSELRWVDIHEPLELALNLLQNEYRDRVQIHREYGQLPPVPCQSGRISQVFLNLISNSCQAIAGSGDIWIRTYYHDSSAVVELEDNGSGIDPEYLNKVFEPFFTTKPVGKGTGLGLSISYGIIQQHRGTIELQSQKGKGTIFRVQLPLTQEAVV